MMHVDHKEILRFAFFYQSNPEEGGLRQIKGSYKIAYCALEIVIYILLGAFILALPLVYQKTYTFTALSFAILMLILQLIQKTYHTWFSGFLLTFLVSLVPFLIVNGVLTYLPVVWYDNTENLGFRIFTIPPEDMIYLFGMLLPSFNVYHILLHTYAPASLRTKMKLDEISGF